MAQKRPPSPSSSGSSDAASSSEEEEEQQRQQVVEKESSDDSDSESPPQAVAKPIASKPKEAAVPAAKPPASDSESDSESESSESSEPGAKPPPPRRSSRGPDPSIKPISSKPMDGTPQSKKAAPQQGSEKKKRKEPEAAEEEEAAVNGVSGKKLFQRVWTEEDEIAVLKGMIQAKNRGDDPESAVDDFLKSIHKSLHSEFSKIQLGDKMRRLKKKYETNMRRSKKGADPSFTKPHDQAAFQLSKKIWGGDVARDYGNDHMEVDSVKKEGGKKAPRKSVPAPVVTSPKRDDGPSAVVKGSSLVDGSNEEGKTAVLYPKLKDAVALLEAENAGKCFVGSLSEAVDLLKPVTAKALEEKWHKHFMTGLKYFWERSELKEDLLKSLIEALENA